MILHHKARYVMTGADIESDSNEFDSPEQAREWMKCVRICNPHMDIWGWDDDGNEY